MAVEAQIAQQEASAEGTPRSGIPPVPLGAQALWPPTAGEAAVEEPDAPRRRLRLPTQPGPRALASLVLLTTMLGAIIGGAIGWWAGAGYSAVALVQGAPAKLQPGGADAADERYAQTEVAYAGIDRAEMRAEVQRRTGSGEASEADVSVLPGTTLLQFAGQGDTAEDAVESANVSAETYVDQWRARTSALLTESLAIIDAQLAATGQVDAARAAQLQEQRATLGAELDTVATTKRIIKPAGEADRSPVYASGAVLGALLGALVGAGAALVWRRR